MPFPRRRAPHRELTDPENERLLGTLTHRSWHRLNVLRLRSEWYKDGVDPANLKHPVDMLVHEAIQSSGSVGGAHREDIREAVKAASIAPPVGVTLGTQAPRTEEATKDTKREKRGF